MTPYELRRLADRKRAEADALVASASRLRATAGSFRDLLASIPDRSRTVWQGPAATDFEERAGAAGRELREEAQLVTGMASGFDREAGDLRAEARTLEERAAAEEAAATLPGASPPSPGGWA